MRLRSPTIPTTALKALQAKPPDLLLLDIMMGRGAEGVMLARKIRKDTRIERNPGVDHYRDQGADRFSLPR